MRDGLAYNEIVNRENTGGIDRHPDPESARSGLGLLCFVILKPELRRGTAARAVSDGSHDGPIEAMACSVLEMGSFPNFTSIADIEETVSP
jgi:hypothetical protein